jgi:hypothetical protein
MRILKLGFVFQKNSSMFGNANVASSIVEVLKLVGLTANA